MNFEIKEIENFNDLLEKLRIDDTQHAQITGEYNGSSGVLKSAYERYINRNEECDYDFIRGMLWGLYATRFITETERETLTEILINN